MKAIVLNSGGVDSTTCVGIAVRDFGADNVSTVTAYYGQKHEREIESSKSVAAYYGIEHREIDLSAIYRESDCPLLSHSGKAIEHSSYADQINNGNGVATYVPFRNGLLLAAVAALAGSLFDGEKVYVYLGAHADDAAGNAYADCSVDFLEAMRTAIEIGTYGKVTLIAPLANLNKSQVVKIGLELGVPYELTWSCYEGGDKPCGECGTCRDRIAAFKANGIEDPAM